ncbi:winged helix-turn-helix domain-containing protein [Amedibacillus sp. YH-ame10]
MKCIDELQSNEQKKIMILLLSENSMIVNEIKYDLCEHLSKQALNLLKLLLLHGKHTIPKEDIMDILWNDANNPQSSLKFYIYKLRKELKEIPGLEFVDIIRTSKQGYYIDECIQSDCYDIETKFEQINYETLLCDELVSDANEIITLYANGLHTTSDSLWFIQKCEYFRGIYLETVDKLCEYYYTHNEFEQLRTLALQSSILEPSVEIHHYNYIRALLALKNFGYAFTYYQSISKIQTDLGYQPSNRMKDLKNQLSDYFEEEVDIHIISNHLKEKKIEDGALCCDRIVFDHLFEVYLRDSKRTNKSYFLIMFQVKSPLTQIPLERLLMRTQTCIQQSLRSQDIMTHISKTQFMVLLHCKEKDDAFSIVQRIMLKFKKYISVEKGRLSYYIEHVI